MSAADLDPVADRERTFPAQVTSGDDLVRAAKLEAIGTVHGRAIICPLWTSLTPARGGGWRRRMCEDAPLAIRFNLRANERSSELRRRPLEERFRAVRSAAIKIMDGLVPVVNEDSDSQTYLGERQRRERWLRSRRSLHLSDHPSADEP